MLELILLNLNSIDYELLIMLGQQELFSENQYFGGTKIKQKQILITCNRKCDADTTQICDLYLKRALYNGMLQLINFF